MFYKSNCDQPFSE